MGETDPQSVAEDVTALPDLCLADSALCADVKSDRREWEKSEEDRILKVGYFSMLAERYPFNRDPSKCSSRESAYLLDLEINHMEIPKELEFPSLLKNIPEEHVDRLNLVWRKVVSTREAWNSARKALFTKWKKVVPTGGHEKNIDFLKSSSMRVNEEFWPALATIIGSSGNENADADNEFLSPDELWKKEERYLRMGFYAADKNYLVAVRLYYEMLLERPAKKNASAGDPIENLPLPEDHPSRKSIDMENRYLRLIDAFHQGITIAKAATHQQEKGRVRKREAVPYVFHDLAVALGQLVDVIPFVIEEEDSSYSFVLSSIVAALHDLDEDTKLKIEDIEEFLSRIVNMYDSAIDPVIHSGFGRQRAEIKEEKLNLINHKVRERLRKILMVLSKKTVLDSESEAKAQALFSKSETFKKYPLSPDDKLSSFFHRLLTITDPEDGQIALIAKNEDRANNMQTLAGGKVETQHSTLIATVTRLIAWQMLDHDHGKYPVYNSLSRLIDVTRIEYERFAIDFSEKIDNNDREYIDQLKKWQVEVRRYQVSDKVQRVLDFYDASHPQIAA